MAGEEMEIGIFKIVPEKKGKEEGLKEEEEKGGEGGKEGGRRIVLSLRAEEIRLALMKREAEQGDGKEGRWVDHKGRKEGRKKSW